MKASTVFVATIFGGTLALQSGDKGAGAKGVHISPDLDFFVQPLPIPAIAKPVHRQEVGIRLGGNHEPRYRMSLDLIHHRFHPNLPPATMYGFNGVHPGPTIEAQTDEPIKVDWVSNLSYPHPLGFAIDPTLGGVKGMPKVRNTIHVHGANVADTSDGLPESWVVPGETLHFRYPNQQEPAMLMYHDHAMGITRLNIYVGLVGLYILRSPGLDESLGLPMGKFDIPLLLQDKSFKADGSLFYPSTGNVVHPIWVPEFFGDYPVVNGVVAPFLVVEPRNYRFRILNGCNSRFLNIYFSEDGLNFKQIGSDGGFLPKPVVLHNITLGPMERADVIVDFREFKGRNISLLNNASTVAAAGGTSNPSLPRLMRFDVLSAGGNEDTTTVPSLLPSPTLPTCIQQNRTMTLEERFVGVKDGNTTVNATDYLLLNNLPFSAPQDTRPVVNTTEIWRVINLTGDIHPIHIHLTRFKVLKRCRFDTTGWDAKGRPDEIEPYIVEPCGDHEGVLPNETGLKDTVRHNPDEVTILKVPFFDFKGTYVWHCHILEHEDNDMMRPFEVVDGSRFCVDQVQD